MCSFRKYPYPHHGGNFTQVVPSSLEFSFLDETDTILLIENTITKHSQQKPLLQQNYIQMDRDKQEYEILKLVKFFL